MALGDGIRRNLKDVEPSERALLRDAFIELNRRFFPGGKNDTDGSGHATPGGVSWWFKQDEIHQATHVHGGPEFIPWHREIVNRLEELLRQINPQLSLHYWDWKEDPTNLQNANLGGGTRGTLNLFTVDFMGYGGSTSQSIGPPWQNAATPFRNDGFYIPGASPDRDSSGNPVDPPLDVRRSVVGSPITLQRENDILNALDYTDMRALMEDAHNDMHRYVRMGGAHISFRDPFVFLLHSNQDRIYARWQTDPAHINDRLDPELVYGRESNLDVHVLDDGGDVIQNVNHQVEPWSTGHSLAFGVDEHFTRPWYAPEGQGIPHTYKDPSIIAPPCYDTNYNLLPIVFVENPGTPPVINFNDIPSGDTAARAAVFKIFACGTATIRVRVGGQPTAPFTLIQPLPDSNGISTVVVQHQLTPFAEARIWVGYIAGAAGVAVPDGSVTFECVESGRTFPFILKANSIQRPRVAVMLALDQSGSMNDPAGTSGAIRIDVLKSAANTFTEVIPDNNGMGIIRFDTDAYDVNDPTYPGLAVTRITSSADRVTASNSVNAHQTNVSGATSVGDGLQKARDVLINTVPATDYEQKAIIVFTDGLENRPLAIADVASSIDNRTFAIGLGNETQVNTASLTTLANGTGGYLRLSGILTPDIDDFFRVKKFFLQILAGVTNNNIIVDPHGYIAPGSTVMIPFVINEADIDSTVILMTDIPVVELALKTPGGILIEQTNAGGLGVKFSSGTETKNYHFHLPIAATSGNHAGTWYTILKINERDYKKYLSKIRENKIAFQRLATHGARYSVVVNTYSNLRMNTTVHQSSFEPGGIIYLRTALTEYGLPVEKRASVKVEIKRPDRTMTSLLLKEVEAGIFENKFQANISGIYVCRFLAKGGTLRGAPFTREQSLDASVFNGGDKPSSPLPNKSIDWCSFLKCLLHDKGVEKYLKENNMNVKTIVNCLQKNCDY